MSLYISLIGIDGSGKSTITPALANLVAAELGLTTVAVGDDCWGKTPAEDLFRPGFIPDREMFVSRLGRLFRQGAKAATARRRLYPPLKLGQLALQERAVSGLATTYQPDVIFSDGNLLFSAAGRVINYVDLQANPTAPTPLSVNLREYLKLTDMPLNPLPYLESLYNYVFAGQPLPPEIVRTIPGLRLMRWLHWLDQQFKLDLLRLPDAVILLDIEPEIALARLRTAGQTLDHHENLHDLSQAQVMYRGVIEFFRRRQGETRTAVIDVTDLSIGQTLAQGIDFVRSLPLQQRDGGAERELLGTTGEALSKPSVMLKKVLSYRYLVRYTLPHLHRGSAHELTFPFSKLGRLFFREGYSARVMRAIYLRDSQKYGLLDTIFLDYPLHRAVYNRLQILQRAVHREIRQRLDNLPPGGTIKVMTAPSGYAFDLFQPLERLTQSGWTGTQSVHILASDLDPAGDIEQELIQTGQALGIRLEFGRGDLTSVGMRDTFKQAGPYDMVLFVGLSCWISKSHLVDHLKLIRRDLLAPGGVLFTDCFTPQAFALSGKYIGYKANYYSPPEFTHILAYCGFDPANIAWTSDPEGINHVCVARAAPCRESAGQIFDGRAVSLCLPASATQILERNYCHSSRL